MTKSSAATSQSGTAGGDWQSDFISASQGGNGADAVALPTLTFNEIANQLTDGYWVSNSDSRHAFNTGTITYNIQAIAADAQALAVQALSAWSAVSGLTFVATQGQAQLTFQQTQPNAYATYVGNAGVTQSAIVNINPQWLIDSGNTVNSYGFQTYLHEIGHTLGLGHGGNYNGNANYSATGGADNFYLNDSWQTTVMSYFDQVQNTTTGATRAFVVGPMIADIIAIQNLYGTPTNTRLGDTTYGFNNTSDPVHNFANYAEGFAPAFAIFDSGGNDTIDASGYTANQFINLNPGTYSNIGGAIGNIGIATNTLVENGIGGSGNDSLLGSGVANTLRGGDGNDTFMGNAGNDVIFGGNGFDTASYFYGRGAIIDMTTGFVQDGEGFTDAVDQVERFDGSGYYRDIFLGNSQANTFNGYGGNDYVIAGDAGADTFNGGNDFDTISYYNSNGAIVNLGSQTAIDGSTGFQQGSTDTVIGFEEVYGSNTAADTIVGDAGNNTFWGFGGNDILVGMQGADTLTGGAGNDLFGFNLGDFQAGIWDTITDFSEAVGNRDILYFAGVNPSSLIFGEANGGTYVSTAALGGTGGFFVAGATQLMISDQLMFA